MCALKQNFTLAQLIGNWPSLINYDTINGISSLNLADWGLNTGWGFTSWGFTDLGTGVVVVLSHTFGNDNIKWPKC